MPKIFISHSSQDRAFIEHTLLPLLRENGLQTWFSSHSIPSASDWEKTIRAALQECDWFLVVLSAQAIASEWVQAEVHWALDHRKDRFVSIIISDCTPSDLHLKLIRYQHVDFRRDHADAIGRLLSVWSIGTEPSATVELECREPGKPAARTVALRIQDSARIGRGLNCELVVESPLVSRSHALLKFSHRDRRLWISDSGSANGVIVNDQPITEPAVLAAGDTVVLGNVHITVVRITTAPTL